MQLLFSKTSLAAVVSLILLSQGEAFTQKGTPVSSISKSNYATPQSFLNVPKATSSKSSSSLQMTAASGAVSVSGGGEVGGGTATIPNEIFNLVKNIVGAGVLSLPAGE